MKPGLWELECELSDSGVYPVCGVDEAGRGPLAGPVCAAAVILPRGAEIPGLDDSKKLTEKKREALYTPITETAVSFGIAFASVEEIEERNILNAALLAMDRAIALLEDAARKRGFLIPGGEVDIDRMANVLLNEYHEGKLGRISLERPPAAERTAEGGGA